MLRTWKGRIGAAVTAVAAVTAIVATQGGTSFGAPTAVANLIDTNGNTGGQVSFAFSGAKTSVRVRVQVPPEFAGFHGFHIHAKGVCDPNATDASGNRAPFTTAGGHAVFFFGQLHGNHDGDLPALFVNADGTAEMTFTTDRLSMERLFDADGSAVMVHVGRDNYAHIPTRYAAGGPDDATLSTGDAGARLLCGVVK